MMLLLLGLSLPLLLVLAAVALLRRHVHRERLRWREAHLARLLETQRLMQQQRAADVAAWRQRVRP